MRRLLAIVAALAALPSAGCSVGAEDELQGAATITATRDFGSERLLQASEDPVPGGETVLRFLMRKADDVETRYGGRFVNAVDGVRSQAGGDGRRDWFYFVNGIEADKGAAEYDVNPGDRVWWDYRDWSAAMRVPAVVGSYPEPFLHGSDGKRFPVRLDCAPDANSQCEAVRDRLEEVGVETAVSVLGTAVGKDTLRVVVGEWADVRADAAVRQLEEGPRESGVFARPAEGGDAVAALDSQGNVSRTFGGGTGLVAATRFEEQQPTWVVTGTDAAGVERAVALLEPRALRDRFAVMAPAGAGAPVRLPSPVAG